MGKISIKREPGEMYEFVIYNEQDEEIGIMYEIDTKDQLTNLFKTLALHGYSIKMRYVHFKDKADEKDE